MDVLLFVYACLLLGNKSVSFSFVFLLMNLEFFLILVFSVFSHTEVAVKIDNGLLFTSHKTVFLQRHKYPQIGVNISTCKVRLAMGQKQRGAVLQFLIPCVL